MLGTSDKLVSESQALSFHEPHKPAGLMCASFCGLLSTDSWRAAVETGPLCSLRRWLLGLQKHGLLAGQRGEERRLGRGKEEGLGNVTLTSLEGEVVGGGGEPKPEFSVRAQVLIPFYCKSQEKHGQRDSVP